MTVVPADPKPAAAGIIRRGAIATIIAVVVNSLLFLIGSLFTFPPEAITPMGGPIELPIVAVLTLGAGIFATIGYLVLTRIMGLTTAHRVTIMVTILVLLGMAVNPFVSIQNAPMSQILILEIMHLVAALPVVALLRRLF